MKVPAFIEDYDILVFTTYIVLYGIQIGYHVDVQALRNIWSFTTNSAYLWMVLCISRGTQFVAKDLYDVKLKRQHGTQSVIKDNICCKGPDMS